MNDDTHRNEAIEFAQWLIRTWCSWWASHGTRILGIVTTAYSGMVSYLAAISSMPEFKLLITPRGFAILAMINVVLGGATFMRGRTNAKP